jgi:NAD(P)H-hydrate epimerase
MVDEIAVRDYGMSGLVLMENAGRGCAEHLLSLGIDGNVVVCCGPGNNGGDGFVIARHLANADMDVTVMVAVNPRDLPADANANFQILAKSKIMIAQVQTDDETHSGARAFLTGGRRPAWIVDALLGTGAMGPARPPYDAWIRLINQSTAKVLAVDIPSGLDCDTGATHGECVQADETCTFVAFKPGFLTGPGRRLAGNVTVIDIGVPKEIVRNVERHQKESRGN